MASHLNSRRNSENHLPIRLNMVTMPLPNLAWAMAYVSNCHRRNACGSNYRLRTIGQCGDVPHPSFLVEEKAPVSSGLHLRLARAGPVFHGWTVDGCVCKIYEHLV